MYRVDGWFKFNERVTNACKPGRVELQAARYAIIHQRVQLTRGVIYTTPHTGWCVRRSSCVYQHTPWRSLSCLCVCLSAGVGCNNGVSCGNVSINSTASFTHRGLHDWVSDILPLVCRRRNGHVIYIYLYIYKYHCRFVCLFVGLFACMLVIANIFHLKSERHETRHVLLLNLSRHSGRFSSERIFELELKV